MSSLIGLALVGATGASPVSAAAPYGSSSFARLGIPTTTYDRARGFDRPVVRYELPPGAHAGGRSWWILHLHLVVRVAPHPRPGASAIFAAATNDVGDAYIRLDAIERGGRTEVVYTESGIVDGIVTHRARGSTIDIRFENYLPFPGVRGGSNRLSYILRQPPGGLVERLTIEPDSALEHTPFRPAQISLGAQLDRTRLRVGDVLHVRGVVRNVGGRPAKWTIVSVDYSQGAFRPIGSGTRRLSAIAERGRGTVSFALRARRAGRLPIGLSAKSSSNRQAVVRYVTVAAAAAPARTQAAAAREDGWGVAWIVVLAVVAIGCAAAAFRSTPALLAGAAAAAVAFAFWRPLIQARLEASLLFAGLSFVVAALLARRARRDGPRLGLRLVALAAALLVANVIALIVLAIAGAD